MSPFRPKHGDTFAAATTYKSQFNANEMFTNYYKCVTVCLVKFLDYLDMWKCGILENIWFRTITLSNWSDIWAHMPIRGQNFDKFGWIIKTRSKWRAIWKTTEAAFIVEFSQMMYLKQVYSCFEVENKPVQCVICFTWARVKSSCFIVDAGVLWEWSAAATVAANRQTSLLPFYCITHDTKKSQTKNR